MIFSFKEVLNSSWTIYKKHWKFIILLGVTTFFAQLFITLIQQGALQDNPFLAFILWMGSALLSIIVTLGWSKVLLALVRHNHADWDTFKTTPQQWLKFIKVFIWMAVYSCVIMFLATVPGLAIAGIGFIFQIQWLLIIGLVVSAIALICASLYVTIRYQFYKFAVLDFGEQRSLAVFRVSSRFTRGASLKLFGWILLSALLVIIGLLLAGIGLFIAIPIVSLGQAKIYTILKAHHEKAIAA